MTEQEKQFKNNSKNFKTFGLKLEVKLPRRRQRTMWVIGQSIDKVATLLWDGHMKVGISTKALNKWIIK